MPKVPKLRAVLTLLAAGLIVSNALAAGLAQAQPSPLYSSVAGESAVQRVAVFGIDERRDLPPAYQSLANKIGVLADLRLRSQCTAFCLSENMIATAAHCLFRTRDETRPDLNNFRFWLQGKQASASARIAGTQSAAAVAHVMTGSMSLTVRPPIEATSDWALARLDKPVCGSGGLPISQHTAEELLKPGLAQPLYQVGYHRDFPGERLAFGAPCRVSRSFEHADWKTITADFDHADQLILHSCDTGGASSGSPLLVDGPNGPEVAGINVGTYVQSRILMIDGAVAHRYQAENVANTGVSARAFADLLPAFARAEFLTVRADMRELQSLLAGVGVFSGPRDGLYGEASRTAIETFERLEGRPITGLATAELLRTLRASNVARTLPAHMPAQAIVETGSVRALGLTSSASKKPVR